MLPRLGLLVCLAVVSAIPGAAWPAPADHPLSVAPLAGVLAAAALSGIWPGVLLSSLVIVGAAAMTGGALGEWGVVIAAPLAAAAMARARRTWSGVAAETTDALEIAGVAAGSALLAAALAGAVGMSGGWGVAVGLGVLAVAPLVGRLLSLLSPRPVVAAVSASSPPEENAGKRVLVVEDDPVNRLVAQEILRTAGHTVVTAADGPEGLRCLDGEDAPFDVVVLDLHMPGLDGGEVLRRLRSLPDPARAGVPVVLLSADVTQQARERGLAAGADAFLTKPVEAKALLAAISVPRRVEAPSALSGEAAVDLDLLESRLGDLGRDSLGRILGLFQDAAPRHLARLHEHASSGDADALRREAHTLKGAAAVIGAERVCELAQAIEQAAGEGELVAEALESLEEIIGATLAAVAAFAHRREVPAAGFRKLSQETSGANT